MSLPEIGLRAAVAASVAWASVGCAASPRVPSTEAFSPMPVKQIIDSSKLVVRCGALGIDVPVLSQSPVLEASVADPVGLGIDGMNCRGDGFTAHRTRLSGGMSAQQVMQKLLVNQGVSGARVPDGASSQSTVLNTDNGQQTGIMVLTSPDGQLVFRVVVEQRGMPVDQFRNYWNRVASGTRLVTQ